MSHLESPGYAAAMAFDGGDSETLDSQVVLDAHRAMFGTALNRGALLPASPNATKRRAAGIHGPKGGVEQEQSDDDDVMLDADQTEEIVLVRSTPSQASTHRDASLVRYPGGKEGLGSFEGTPTQLVGEEERTLCANEMGAVNFDLLTDNDRPSSQITMDPGLETTMGAWRELDKYTSRANSPEEYCDVGVMTPEQPRNPFASKADTSVPLTATQLFKQTQPINTLNPPSPTSSRPSPKVVKMASLSSPLIRTHTSPLKDCTDSSSPPMNHVSDTTLPAQQDVEGEASREERVPESPRCPSPKAPTCRGRLTHYEPMEQSQERKKNRRVEARRTVISDDDSFTRDQKRREIVRRQRAQALEEMDKVSFTRHSRRLSMDKPCRKKRRLQDAHQGPSLEPPAVEKPQKSSMPSFGPPSAESTKATQGHEIAMDQDQVRVEAVVDDEAETQGTEEDLIPATSPMQCSSATTPHGTASVSRVESLAQVEDSTDADVEMQFSPDIRQRQQKTYGGRTRRSTRTSAFLDSSMTEALLTLEHGGASNSTTRASTADANEAAAEPLEPEAPVTKKRASRRDSARVQAKARSGAVRDRPLTPQQPSADQKAPATPGTLDSMASYSTFTTGGLSEASKDLRKHALRATAKSESPRRRPEPRRMSTRSSMRTCSDSADELQCADIGIHSFELDNGAIPRAGKSFRPSSKNGRLFEGMAFALTSRLDQPEQRRRLESQITVAGGSILCEGFQELFDSGLMVGSSGKTLADVDSNLKLLRTNSTRGFTALIADGHSRKPKFLQALALGLPCLAHQWITSCVKKGQVVDWTPYLLCAGTSVVLGNAIRSRSLMPYPAADARLAETLQRRPRLLQGQSVLAVVADGKKTGWEATRQYVFLVQALGPADMSRVTTVQQAREMLRARHFDWIYVDKAVGSVEAILGQETTASRKRKAAPAMGMRARVLADELLVQSLILGRMVEIGEMD